MGKSIATTVLLTLLCLAASSSLLAQNKIITVPKPVEGTPFKVNDSGGLLGKAYRWFMEGEVRWAADSLVKLIDASGFRMNPNDYHIVVTNFTDKLTPIGLLHAGSDFMDTRLYGLHDANLYYIFISKRENAESFLSVTLTAKDSPFQSGILDFIRLFVPIPIAQSISGGATDVWLDIRKFEIPEKFQKNSDINVIVKKDLGTEEFLAVAEFDNTAKEQWSFGIATAITSANDVDIIVDNGVIVVKPQPFGDFASFGVLNYHFSPVDTKQPTVASSFHLLGGLRLAGYVEPLVGVGFGFPTGFPIEVHLFGGISANFTNKLKSGFAVGDQVAEGVDPFKLKVRVRPRFGIELKFP